MAYEQVNVSVNSEIGKLEHVLVHTPGVEIENMTPDTAHQFLYSDILNLQVAQKEYNYFQRVLKKVASVHEISDMLADILQNDIIKNNLVDRICKNEGIEYLADYLKTLDRKELAKGLIEGIRIKDIKYIDNQQFSLLPLPNLFFMRDASFSMFDQLMISNMATKVRSRETLILETIYSCHPILNAPVQNPALRYSALDTGTIEGGDVHIVRDDVVLCGLSARTNMSGINSLVEHLKSRPGIKHLIFQELPKEPESFIHLDMVFSMVDIDRCVVYEPVVMSHSLKTFHIIIDENQRAVGQDERNLITALNGLGIPVEPVLCGGGNPMYAAREQWHSGTNFFALAPGKCIGYGRNYHTLEALNQAGFDIVTAADVVNDKVKLDKVKRCIIAFEGNELSRGGGGARCMTMPIQRQAVDWNR